MPSMRAARRFVFAIVLILSAALSARPQSADESTSSSPESELLAVAAAEGARGVYVFYTQSFVEKENKRASYKGSIYGAIQDVQLKGCELKINIYLVDNFSVTGGKSQ